MVNVKVIYATITGNTEALVELFVEKFEEAYEDADVEVIDIDDFDTEDLADADAFVIGTFTYGDGELPDEMEDFYEEVLDLDLTGKPFGVLGTGDTLYETFCNAGDILAERLVSVGANHVTTDVKIDIIVETEEDYAQVDKFVADFKAACEALDK